MATVGANTSAGHIDPESPRQLGTAPTILVVDDDRVTRHMISRALQNYGYEVIDAGNGAEAVERCRHEHPDMVLLDVNMPEMNGYEACSAIRHMARAEQLPIAMLTGTDDVDAVERAFQAGATDFITKPINWSLLGQRIRYGLRTRELHLELKEQQQRLSHAQQLARLGYWEYCPIRDTLTLSEETCGILGIDSPPGQAGLSFLLQYVHPDNREELTQVLGELLANNEPFNLEHRITSDNERILTVQHQAQWLDAMDGRSRRIVGTLQDITERKQFQALVNYRTYRDDTTGLPNQRMFREHLQASLEQSDRDALSAVVFVGLDRLGDVRDHLGFSATNDLLRAAGKRLHYFAQNGNLLARFDEHHFALWIQNCGTADELEHTVNDIRHRLSRPYQLDEQEVFSAASAGIALDSFSDSNAEQLVKEASAAVAMAERAGGDRTEFYWSEIEKQARTRLNMEKELRKAIDNEEFRIYYQPQIDIASGKVCGTEALLRWIHPQRGMISPDQFIPVAEDTGLIVPIGRWVLEQACVDARHWLDTGIGKLRVGVNLSVRQMSNKGLTRHIEDAIDLAGLDPDQLDVEITESMAMNDFQSNLKLLNTIREMGVHTSMDDFGTGYSSLSHLQKLPLNVLKVDRAFLKEINTGENSGAITRAIVAMAHGLGLQVIAEGVENTIQLDFLRTLGCETAQGFLYSPPVPMDRFVDYVKQAAVQGSAPWSH